MISEVPENVKCSFCEKGEESEDGIFVGAESAICEGCVRKLSRRMAIASRGLDTEVVRL